MWYQVCPPLWRAWCVLRSNDTDFTGVCPQTRGCGTRGGRAAAHVLADVRHGRRHAHTRRHDGIPVSPPADQCRFACHHSQGLCTAQTPVPVHAATRHVAGLLRQVLTSMAELPHDKAAGISCSQQHCAVTLPYIVGISYTRTIQIREHATFGRILLVEYRMEFTAGGGHVRCAV